MSPLPFPEISMFPPVWQTLYDGIKNCRRCSIAAEASDKPTPFYGNPASKVMFLGRNPGIQERDIGIPFVGQTLSYMEEMFHSLGFRRECFYVTNVVKCYTSWPKSDRPPTTQECAFCAKAHLIPELALLKPRLIVALGNQALQLLTDQTSVVPTNGSVFPCKYGAGLKVFSMLHPGYVMRAHNKLGPAWDSAVSKLKEYLDQNQWFGDWSGLF